MEPSEVRGLDPLAARGTFCTLRRPALVTLHQTVVLKGAA